MEIRKDFQSAAPYLHRLWLYGEEFARFANDDWPHMKNQEDYQKVYQLEDPVRRLFERLYGDGRDMAIYMSGHLRNFNSMSDFPSMVSYVESFEQNWCGNVERYRALIGEFKRCQELPGTPWAVGQMIQIWATQVRLLDAVNDTVRLLKQTDIYRIEKGEIKVSDLNKQSVNVGVIGNVHGSRVNVSSTDNSTNVHISTHEVFAHIREALDKASLPEPQKANLVQCVQAMEAEVGKPTFTSRYRDFVAAAADHMTLLSPFLPALTALLG